MSGRAHATGCGALAADARGVVIVEFLIAFGPLFVLFLATVQLGLIAAASLVVRHAAVVGVRAAIVVLDDEPRFYAGAARGSLAGDGDPDPNWGQRFGQRLGGDRAALSPSRAAHDAPRTQAIRRAVETRIAALTPDRSILGAWIASSTPLNVSDALGKAPLLRLAFGLARYAGITTAVTFPTAPGATTLSVARVDQSARITLRVTHLFVCLVPIAAALMCDSLTWDARARRLAEPAHANTNPTRAQRTRELRLAPFADDQRALANAGMHAWLLSAEATLPAQAAAYRYASERTDEASQ